MTVSNLNLGDTLRQFQGTMDALLALEAGSQVPPQAAGSIDLLGMHLDTMRQGLGDLCKGTETAAVSPYSIFQAQTQRCQVLQDVLKFDRRDQFAYQAVQGVMRGLRLCGMLPNVGESFDAWLEWVVENFYVAATNLPLFETERLGNAVIGKGVVAKIRPDIFGFKAYKCFSEKNLRDGIKEFRETPYLALGWWKELYLTTHVEDFGLRNNSGEPYYYLKLPQFIKPELTKPKALEKATVQQKEAFARELAGLICEEHVRGVVHGDIKKDNVMQTRSGRLTLIDYGFARMFSDPLNVRAKYWEPHSNPPTLQDDPKIDVQFYAALLLDIFMSCDKMEDLHQAVEQFQNASGEAFSSDSKLIQIPPRLRPILKQALTPESYPSGVELVQAIEVAFSVG